MSAIVFSGTPTASQNLVPTPTLTTLERLLLWCLFVFWRLNNRKDISLIDGEAVKQITQQRFLGDDDRLYLGFTVFMPVSAEYEVGSDKPWTYAIELNNAVASTAFNS